MHPAAALAIAAMTAPSVQKGMMEHLQNTIFMLWAHKVEQIQQPSGPVLKEAGASPQFCQQMR